MNDIAVAIIALMPLIVLTVLMSQKRKAHTVLITCMLVGLVAAIILELGVSQHPHIPVPIWAMFEVLVGAVIPLACVLIRAIINWRKTKHVEVSPKEEVKQ